MEQAGQVKTCAKCGDEPAGPGGVLCPPCKTVIEGQTAGWSYDNAAVNKQG